MMKAKHSAGIWYLSSKARDVTSKNTTVYITFVVFGCIRDMTEQVSTTTTTTTTTTTAAATTITTTTITAVTITTITTV